jgi:methionine synthase I (cobalamin-dependent)
MSNLITDLITEKGWCVADGATSSNFFGRGLEAGYPPNLWCVEKPGEVLWLHGAFLEADADIMLTNSFGANSPRLKLHKAEHRVTELNAAGIEIPVVAKGNCSIPQYVDGAIHFHGSPELMAQYALYARDAGATIIGGRCGTTPEHIAAMVNALDSTPRSALDTEAMTGALGTPRAALAETEAGSGGEKRRERRRRG